MHIKGQVADMFHSSSLPDVAWLTIDFLMAENLLQSVMFKHQRERNQEMQVSQSLPGLQ